MGVGLAAAAIGAATSIGTAYMAKKDAKKQAKTAQQGIEAADPLRQYRPKYAEQLDKLMSDPSSIVDTPEYKARQMAAQRQMSAQGYTGSGNAIIEAAEAGGQSYAEAVNRLSGLAGGTPGAGYDAALSANQAASDTKLSSYAGVANNLSNLAMTAFGNRSAGGGPGPTMQATPSFNMPAPKVSVPNVQFTPPPISPLNTGG